MPFPVPIAEIEKTERSLRCRFPLLMRSQMMRENGGVLEIGGEAWRLLPFRDGSTRKTLARSTTDILSETQAMRSSGVGFPADGAAIAQNGTGDYLVLLPDEASPERFSSTARIWRLRGADMSGEVDVDELFETLVKQS
jgi:hypothetical protein